MMELQEVLKIHEILIRKFGGSEGLRDKGLLLSALQRPFGGFGETVFYPSAEEKAAAILESIVKNHPFVDGNKRTAYVLMRLLLMQFGKDIKATEDEKYQFVIEIASGNMDFSTILAWLRKRLV